MSSNPATFPSEDSHEVKKCILCNMDRQLTAEHIFADWIGRATGYTSKYSIATLQTAKTIKQSTTPGNHAERTLKILCNECNNEWGSRLQNKTSPILKPLILGQRYNLSKHEQEQIARWLTCFVMIREFVHPELKTISQETRSKFRKSSIIPRGMAMWMAPFSGTKSNLSTWHRAFITSTPKTQEASPDTHFTILVISNVLFFVFGSSNKAFANPGQLEMHALSAYLNEAGLMQIWPTRKNKDAQHILNDTHFEHIIRAATSAVNNPLSYFLDARSSWNDGQPQT